jgi:hypothetical protein
MFNLLTEKEKKFLRIEYRRRKMIVWLGLFSSLLAIAIVFLIPSFALLYSKTNFIFSDVTLFQKEDKNFNDLKKEIDKTRKTMAVFDKNFFASSSISNIETLVANRPSGIKINSFGLSFGDKNILQIQGIATNRDSLRKFHDYINSLNLFDKFDIPIASLTRESNIPFSIILNVKKTAI